MVDLLTQDDDAGRDAGAVKKVGRDADDRLDQVIFDDLLADLPLITAPEQNAVRHDGCNHPTFTGYGQHVLQEHQVGLLGAQGHLMEEALRELRLPGRIACLVLVGCPPID